MADKVKIFCDGSYYQNSRAGAWGVTLSIGENRRHYAGGYIQYMSSYIMELNAIIYALKLASQVKNPKSVTIFSDCKSIVNLINSSTKKDFKIKNSYSCKPLLRKIISFFKSLVAKGVNIFVKHVKAHVGILGNEIADKLAKIAVKKKLETPTVVNMSLNNFQQKCKKKSKK